MENYNDDFIIGCEDLSSNAENRRRSDNGAQDYRRRNGDYPSPQSRNSQPYYARYNGEVNRAPSRNGAIDHTNRYRGYDRQRDSAQYRERQAAYRQYKDPRGYEQPPVKNTRKKGFNLSKKLFITICLILVLTITAGIITIAVLSSGVDSVPSLKSSDVGANQVILSWEKVKNADGYRIMAAKDTEELKEIQSIDNPDTVSVTVSGLDQASLYHFSVITISGKKQSSPAKLDNVRTLPETPTITSLYSAEPGTVHLDWTKNDAANGYIVQYKKGAEDYSDDMSVTISDPDQCNTDITDLEINADYTVRVYSYVTFDETLNSAPSQEQSVTVSAESVEVVPKAMDQQVDGTIDPDKPMIALTFDDGPAVNGDSSDRILDVLEQNHAKATFFMVGYYASENTGNVQRKADLKMELGNHTWDHTHYGNAVTPDDIRKASNQVYDITGQYTTCFRSPGGETTGAILSECANENMPLYYWSIDTQDWNSRNADAVYHSVMDNVKDGDIILMHEIYDSTAEAVERMVPELIEQGYQLVTCHDLIKLKGGSDPEPGTQYVNAFTQSDI